MDDNEPDAPRPRAALRRASLIGLGVLACGTAVLWSQRTQIASRMIDRTLVQSRVPATYRIDRLNPAGALLSNVVVGDPAHPDFTARKLALRLRWGLGGAEIAAIAMEGARLNARLDGNGLHMGAIDRLLPKSTGAPFTLPDFRLALTDSRMTLNTDMGRIGLAAEGSGRLSDGFAGRIALSAPRLQRGGCTISNANSVQRLSIVARVARLSGPAHMDGLHCGDAGTGAAEIGLTALLPEAMDHGHGRIDGHVQALTQKGVGRVEEARLTGSFDAAPKTGRYGYRGVVSWADAAIDRQLRASIVKAGAAADATPAGPVARKAADDLARAMGRFGGSAQVSLGLNERGLSADFSNPAIASASGLKLAGEGRLLRWVGATGRMHVDGLITMSGGGLPGARIAIRPTGPDSWRADARIDPLAAGHARLALGPVRMEWDAAHGRGHAVTGVAMNGPLADGQVTALALPVDVRFGSGGDFALGKPGACTRLAFDRLETGGMALGRMALPLCARKGQPLLAMDGKGRLQGGFSLARLNIDTNMDGAPLALDAHRLTIDLGGTSRQPRLAFTIGDTSASLGRPDGGKSMLRLASASGAGRIDDLQGRMSGVAGSIANVPLLIDRGEGQWRLADGTLRISGARAQVSDAAGPARFVPVEARGVTMTLGRQVLTADGAIHNPATGKRLALVKLNHDFSRGRGEAHFTVPSLLFSENLQPEQLTPLTRGVIANVYGAIKGQGTIRWNARGVTSDGVFETDGIDLAAAFGPVSKLHGRVVFNDLLGLSTPPGQVAMVGEINPGVSAKDGVIHYQLLPQQQVKVEKGEWPFAGGQLLLEPTLLDFGKPNDRRFTLTVNGLQAARFIEQFDFKNVAVTGTFDGTLPLIFDARGGRITGGHLIARQPGGTLAYVGEVSDADMGRTAKLAFDALKSLKYDSLSIDMDGRLDGEIVSRLRFSGTNQAPVNPTASPIPIKVTGLPFKFNIAITAPFRALLNTAESFTDVRTTVRQAMPADPDAVPGAAPVQPQDR